MDALTYSLSENYFWRYRLLDLMEKICKKRPMDHIEKRDPEWFVEQYSRFFAYPGEDQHRRLICDSDDSDFDDEGNRRIPRQPLHLHRGAILGLFATHAEWIITHELSRKNRTINVEAWDRFRRGERREVENSRKEEGSDEEDISKRSLQVSSKSILFVNRTEPLEIAKQKQPRGRTFKMESSSESESDPGEGHAYASDFSESSDSAWGFDEASDDGNQDQDVLDAIPWQLWMLPRPPDADGCWRCPLSTCRYEFDLRNLTEDECWNVDRAVADYILGKKWNNVYQDGTVLEGWLQMVRNHYDIHFAEVGVAWADPNTRVRIFRFYRHSRTHF